MSIDIKKIVNATSAAEQAKANSGWTNYKDVDQVCDDIADKTDLFFLRGNNQKKFTYNKQLVYLTSADIAQQLLLEKDINEMDGILMDIEDLNDQIYAWNEEENNKFNDKMKRIEVLIKKQENGTITEDETKELQNLQENLYVNESEGTIASLNSQIAQKQESAKTEIDKIAISKSYVEKTYSIVKDLKEIDKEAEIIEPSVKAADNLNSAVSEYASLKNSIFKAK